ncbi:MAG: prolyl oligopeptidase family serine peptidase [Candidatus Hodarchaeales archaeon]
MRKLEQEALNYPPTRIDSVKETLHGVTITDHFRWLEDLTNPDVKKWIKSQNLHTRNILDQISGRESFRETFSKLLKVEEVFTPKESQRGWFYQKQHPEKQQPILYLRLKDTSDNEEPIVDVNEMDSTGLTSLDWWEPSLDGKFLAYGLSREGSEWSTGYIMNIETRTILEETIERTRFCELSWNEDNSGFYYTRFFKKGEVPEGEEHFHSHIRYHNLGAESDPIIYHDPSRPHEYPIPVVSKNRNFMIIMKHRFVANDLYFIDLTSSDPVATPILTESKWLISVQISEKYIYFMSNHESPHYGLYRTTKENLDIKKWECIIPPTDDIIQSFGLSGNKISVLWLKNIVSRLTIHDSDGKFEQEVGIPSNGAVSVVNARPEFMNIYFNFQSFYQPPIIFEYQLQTKNLNIFAEKVLPIDTSNFTVTRVWYPSKDETKVHMFILHPKNIELNGNNPTLLYGYGGFAVSLTPWFSSSFNTWLSHGGVVAVSNIRGGGELGQDWHKNGRLEKKQKCFDDFIAAAEYLINQGYCSPNTLGIFGGSNGGLLVGAVTTQRPALFKAVYCSVPLLDMLRYHHFSLGKTWIPEYGDPDDPKHFQWLSSYSPYQQVKENTEYPAILFYTAEADTRVEPIHAMKMAALMQGFSSSKNPILFWFEPAAGHGVGTPLNKIIDEYTDLLAFFCFFLEFKVQK